MKQNQLKEASVVKQRFATRKLKKGLVSVLVGFTMLFGNIPGMIIATPGMTGIVHAAEADKQEENNYKENIYIYTNDDYYYAFQGNNEEVWESNNAKQDVNASVQVLTSPINDKGEQEWTLIFNKTGVYKTGTYTSKPRLGFSISKNLEIKPLSNNNGQLANGIEINLGNDTKHIESGEGFKRNSLRFNSQSLSLLNFNSKTPKNQLLDRYFPNFELFRMNDYLNGQNNQEQKDKFNEFLNQSNEVYSFQLDNDQLGKATATVTIKFTTVDKSFVRKGHYNEGLFKIISEYLTNENNSAESSSESSRVTAIYFSWDNGIFSRVDSLSKPLDYTKDTDGDGLVDKYEIFLGTNPNNRDTDGDGRTDGEEVYRHIGYAKTIPTSGTGAVASYWDEYPAAYILNGTNPLVGIPTVPEKIIGKVGEVVEGKTDPWTVVSLKIWDKNKNNSPTWHPVGEAISDKNGHYRIEIGSILKTSKAINLFGNEKELGSPNKTDPNLNDDLNGKMQY